ncbi:alpha/beta fold hydrolase [Flaviaesturariibacter amylovorans]|uniref:AB hydrolase-1 domain-containing protein n=1 Tax=Flaviaesturariibacter amylovorans TaxID=1084520 RepID=A0ABP8GT98_9BACT
MSRFLLYFLLLLSSALAAQKKVGFGLSEFSFRDARYGKINYYVSTRGLTERKPVLLYLEGSGCFPLFRLYDDGQNCCIEHRFVLLDIDSLAQHYHVVLFPKPGLPLSDTIRVSSYDSLRGFESGPCPPAYNEHLSLEWRAGNATSILNDLLKRVPHDPKKVVVMGNSEGGQVAPRVAVLNQRVTHCINICGSGLNQLYTPLIKARQQARQGHITYEESERIVDSLFAVYRGLFAAPQRTDTSWYGLTYKRWASFAALPPIESYTRLCIPVYIAIGSRDDNGDVLSTDYVQLEFFRLGKKNLTYKVYPNYDHHFNQYVLVDGKERRVRRSAEVIGAALRWVDGR